MSYANNENILSNQKYVNFKQKYFSFQDIRQNCLLIMWITWLCIPHNTIKPKNNAKFE